MANVYAFMKVTEHGEWIESNRWYEWREEAELRKEYLEKKFLILGYIVTAELGEVKRVE